MYLPVDEGTDFLQLGFLLEGQKILGVRHVEYVHFGQTHDARLLPILKAERSVPQPQLLL